jgi:hypothetical protein
MPASKAQRAQTAERRGKAIALRLAGLDYETIAQRLGYSGRAAAYKDIERALAANLAQERASSEELRKVELLRLDRLQAAAWQAAATGDLRAIETVLKVIDRRCKLLGLDAPVRSRVEIVDDELAQALVAQLESELASLTEDPDRSGTGNPPADR